MPVQTYAVYTRCNQCGVYDRDPDWCALCARPKESVSGHQAIAHRPSAPPNAARVDRRRLTRLTPTR